MERERIQVTEETAASLAEYATIPIAFQVASVFIVEDREPGADRLMLGELRLASPYVKDYDAAEGEGPMAWAGHFDLSSWGFLAARVDGRRVGGAAVAFDTPGVQMLEGRRDLAVLWDIRVAPEACRLGVGAALFRAAEGWARARGCRQLKVETQNVNVAACTFYARMGCMPAEVNHGAYPGLPDEVQLIWRKDLAPVP